MKDSLFIIKADTITLSGAQEEMIREKFSKLRQLSARLDDESSELKVEVGHEETRKDDHQYTCILTLFVPGSTIRAESRGATLENAIDECIDKTKRQIEHYKAKVEGLNER